MPKNLVVETFCAVFQYFPVVKKFMDKRGQVSRFFVEVFLSHSAESFRGGILYCSVNFGYRKSLDKRGGGVSRFSVEIFLSHSAKNFRKGILYCCIRFGYRKSLGGGGGGVSRFFVEVFVSQCQKFP